VRRRSDPIGSITVHLNLLLPVKTTIDLPDELLQRAKIVAAQRRTTLKDLVVQGLEYTTTQCLPEPEVQRSTRAQKLLDALEATNTQPMKPLKRDEIYDR
jgi:hypothetical protein